MLFDRKRKQITFYEMYLLLLRVVFVTQGTLSRQVWIFWKIHPVWNRTRRKTQSKVRRFPSRRESVRKRRINTQRSLYSFFTSTLSCSPPLLQHPLRVYFLNTTSTDKFSSPCGSTARYYTNRCLVVS